MKASSAHASPDEVALYVIDALAHPARQRLESHVAACPSCAGALASEAVAEQTLRALWPSVRRPLAEVVPLPRPESTRASAPSSTRSSLGLQGSFGGLAAAVVAVLFFGWWLDAGQMVRTIDTSAGDRLASRTSCHLPGAALSTAGSGEARSCAPRPIRSLSCRPGQLGDVCGRAGLDRRAVRCGSGFAPRAGVRAVRGAVDTALP